MNNNWNADELVTCVSQNTERYKRNFLRQVVCELRFPTLMELGEPKPPAILVNALRKEYPHLELANEISIGIGNGATGSNHAHIFRSSKLNWSVSLKQSSIAIETTTYTNYAQMKERVLRVIDAASKIIDSDFFTRVAIRYINTVNSGEDPREGWINSELVAPLLSGHFSGIQEFSGRLNLVAEDGGCLLQHGTRWQKPHGMEEEVPLYVLDIDTYRNEVLMEHIESALDSIHVQSFKLFDWSLGPKARESLSLDNTSKNSGGRS